MSFENTGRVWTPNSLKSYLQTLKKPSFVNCIVIHHTASPSLAQRPKGFTIQHIENIKSFYSKELGWSRGPHFFTDEDQIFGMTPPTMPGVHAVSFNSRSIGIEVLGNYDSEDPLTGRGFECWNTTAEAVVVLTEWLGLEINDKTILFHREDPKTSKTCPGIKIFKPWFINLINSKRTTTKPVEPTIPNTKDIIPVVDYVVLNKGYTMTEAVQGLSVVDGKVLFDGESIPSARYDKIVNATVASVDDLRKIKSK